MTPTKDTLVVAARLPNDLVTQMDRTCTRQTITRSIFLRKAISWYLQYGPRRNL